MVQQIRRNLRAAWKKIRRQPFRESDISPAPNPDRDRRFWFEDDSRFQRALKRYLWTDADHVRFERVLWSGSNTFDARLEGAARLMRHLREARERFPDAKHVVVAHSHGGTVAAMALARETDRGTPVAEGLLTLGTPFVRLVMRQQRSRPSLLAVLIGGTLPVFSLCIAPILSVSLLLRGETWRWLALALVVSAVIGAVARQPTLTAIVAATAFVCGGVGVRSDALVWGIAAIFIAGMAALKTSWGLSLAGFGYVQREPYNLGCPLVAIRTPNDEASLTIGIAQTLERGYRLASGLLVSFVSSLTAPLRRWEGRMEKIHPWVGGAFIIVCLALPPIALVAARDAWMGFSREWWQYVLVGGYLPGMALAVALSCAVLLWLVLGMFLSLAAGPESFAAPLIGLDAEPLPFARPEKSMSLIIDVKAGQSGGSGSSLNHSLHDVRRIRLRVASWIRSQLH